MFGKFNINSIISPYVGIRRYPEFRNFGSRGLVQFARIADWSGKPTPLAPTPLGGLIASLSYDVSDGVEAFGDDIDTGAAAFGDVLDMQTGASAFDGLGQEAGSGVKGTLLVAAALAIAALAVWGVLKGKDTMSKRRDAKKWRK